MVDPSGKGVAILNAGATAFGSATYGEGTGPILLLDVGCLGNEERLEDCNITPRERPCTHSEDAGVRCPNYPGKLISDNLIVYSTT